MAHGDAAKVSVDAGSHTAAKPVGGVAGRGPYQLSSLVSDLLGASAQRIHQALVNGETDTAALADLADKRLRATAEQLSDSLGAAHDLR